MNPIFTVPYSEYIVAQKLKAELKCSVFIPMSAQEKGIDLLFYKFEDGKNKILTVQVKNSRSYVEKEGDIICHGLWFNRFEPQDNADWFILVGLYPSLQQDTEYKGKINWGEIFLAFTYSEMKEFMVNLTQKKNNSKPDKMFCFRFRKNDNKELIIEQTRGYHENGIDKRDMSKYLLEKRIEEIKRSLK